MQTQKFGAVNFSDGTWGLNFNVEQGDDMWVKQIVRPDLQNVSHMAHVEERDFVYSDKQELVGVVLAVDKVAGMISVYLGSEVAVFNWIGTRFVRTWWDKTRMTYSWETVMVLRDE